MQFVTRDQVSPTSSGFGRAATETELSIATRRMATGMSQLVNEIAAIMGRLSCKEMREDRVR